MRLSKGSRTTVGVMLIFHCALASVGYGLSRGQPQARPPDVVGSGGPKLTEGISGSAYYFDGEGDYIDIGSDPSIQMEILTIAAWIKTSDTEAPWQTIVSYEAGSHAVSVLPNGRVHYGWQEIKTGLEGTSEVRTGKWVFAAVTRDSDYRACVYVNGQLEESFVDDTKSSFARGAKIGGDAVNGEYFHGTIDEVAIFNRPLSGEEMQQLYHNRGSLTGSERGLVGYWNFDRDEDDIVKDRSDNGNNGRLGDLRDAPPAQSPPFVGTGGVVGSTSSWTDGQAKFTLSVAGGLGNEHFIATISIENLTDDALSFPMPMVMPLAGDTNKNNIRIYDTSGKKLEMTGKHGDFVRHPFTEIAPRSSQSWQFRLEKNFPGLSEPGRYRAELWYFANESGPGVWTGRVNMEPVIIERGGATDVRTALRAVPSVATTSDHKSIMISPVNLKFEVPQRWTTLHCEHAENFHLTRGELDLVMHGQGEWDFEYAKLVNSVLPFQGCAAHVGDEGWGRKGSGYGDIQLRVYILENSPEQIEYAVSEISAERPRSIFPRGSGSYEDSFRLERDTNTLWRKSKISYITFYGDYGAEAYVDFRSRQFGNKTAAFVFMYTHFRDQEGTIRQILGSVVCPYDSGTLKSGKEGQAGPVRVEGISGSAYYFDGEGDFINIEDSPSLDISGSEITVSAWIKPEAIDKRQVIVAKTAGGDNTWIVEINPVDFGPGAISWYIDIDGIDGNFGSSRVVQVGRWQHVACVYDGMQRAIYIDGQFAGQQAVSGDIHTNDQPVRIGGWGSSWRFFQGTIDEVLIYARALPAYEIQELHRHVGRARDYEIGLVGYWNFNADEGETVKDSSANHNDGAFGSAIDSIRGEPDEVSTSGLR